MKMHDLSFVDNDMEKEKMISNLIYLFISIGMEMSAVMRFIFCMHRERYAVTQIYFLHNGECYLLSVHFLSCP